MTQAFSKPAIAPPAPAWIVRRPPLAVAHDVETIEVVFVGHMLRDELDRAVERLARWPWPFGADDKAAGVELLGDTHADLVGIRLTGDSLALSHVVAIVADLFDASIVCQATQPRTREALHRKG